MENWDGLLEPIRSDTTSGAAELAKRAVGVLHRWLEGTSPLSPGDWRPAFFAFGHALVAAQPAMAPLFNLVNAAFLAVETAPMGAEAQQLHHTAQAFLQELEQSPSRLVHAALSLLSADVRVLTFSYSSTVLEVLRAAHTHGIRLTVFCTEGRPILEGRRLARQLAEAGIEVRFGVDAALSIFLPQVSLALVGADSITTGGVVNKVGTATLAMAARQAHIPCFVIGGRQKCFPAAAPLPTFHPSRPADEVWPDAPAGVTIWNAYFECTPLTSFDGMVMETGVLTPQAVTQELATLPVAKTLRTRRR